MNTASDVQISGEIYDYREGYTKLISGDIQMSGEIYKYREGYTNVGGDL